jgi:hypothetical protein
MSRLTVGEALAARLFAAETAVDQALIEVATFAAALPAARTDAWLSAVTGQRAFDGAAAALTHLTEARAQLGPHTGPWPRSRIGWDWMSLRSAPSTSPAMTRQSVGAAETGPGSPRTW